MAHLMVAGYVIYRCRVVRGGRKRPVPKGATYGKPTNQGVNQLKNQRSHQAIAEVNILIDILNKKSDFCPIFTPVPSDTES